MKTIIALSLLLSGCVGLSTGPNVAWYEHWNEPNDPERYRLAMNRCIPATRKLPMAVWESVRVTDDEAQCMRDLGYTPVSY